MIEEYLEQCRDLSVTARVCIAALIFEEYCKRLKLQSPYIPEFLESIWQFPLLKGDQDAFKRWDREPPELYHVGFGADYPPDLLADLQALGIDQDNFRNMVKGVSEMLWGNFYVGGIDEWSIEYLEVVLNASGLDTFPPIEPFTISRITDRVGWGRHITEAERDQWRQCYRR